MKIYTTESKGVNTEIWMMVILRYGEAGEIRWINLSCYTILAFIVGSLFTKNK